MVKTRADLVERALKNLGVLPQGQTPNTEDYNAVDQLVRPTIEDLVARDVVHIADPDAIENKYFMPLGLILAWNAAAEFGQGSDPALAALAQKAEMDLRKINASYPTYDHLEIQAY